MRRTIRLGLGTCQGGFCVYRAAPRHEHRNEGDEPSAAATNLALSDVLEERRRGITPGLWGDQLRQELLDELMYFGILGIDRLSVATPADVDWLVPSATMGEG